MFQNRCQPLIRGNAADLLVLRVFSGNAQRLQIRVPPFRGQDLVTAPVSVEIRGIHVNVH